MMIEKLGLQALKGLQTPFLVYDTENVRERLVFLKKELERLNAKYLVAYAYKTNPHLAGTLSNDGCSFFVTSFAHLMKVQRMNPPLIIFNHPAYTEEELSQLLVEKDVLTVIESEDQLTLANKVCKQEGVVGEILLRIDTNARSAATPFKPKYNLGVTIEKAQEVLQGAQNLRNIRVIGLHNHFASQNTDLQSWRKNAEKISKIMESFPSLNTLNLGGGIPVQYEEENISVKDIIDAINESVSRLNKNKALRLILEPGRYLVANSGKLFTRVLDVRQRDVPETIVDASLLTCFGDRLFYGLTLKTRAENLTSSGKSVTYRVLGNSSVSIDDFGELNLNRIKVGDLLVFHNAGAYFTSISTDFTGVARPEEFLLVNDKLQPV